MTLIVEDGTVVAGANSFVSLEFAGSYHALRGNAAWAAADETSQTAALVKATFYLDRLRWKGIKTGVNNPLAWPRYGDDAQGWNYMVLPSSPFMGVIDEDGYDVGTATVPERVKQACCEMALRILLGADPEPDLARGGRVRSQTIDVISTTFEAGASPVPEYTMITRMLRGLLRATVATTIRLGW